MAMLPRSKNVILEETVRLNENMNLFLSEMLSWQTTIFAVHIHEFILHGMQKVNTLFPLNYVPSTSHGQRKALPATAAASMIC